MLRKKKIFLLVVCMLLITVLCCYRMLANDQRSIALHNTTMAIPTTWIDHSYKSSSNNIVKLTLDVPVCHHYGFDENDLQSNCVHLPNFPLPEAVIFIKNLPDYILTTKSMPQRLKYSNCDQLASIEDYSSDLWTCKGKLTHDYYIPKNQPAISVFGNCVKDALTRKRGYGCALVSDYNQDFNYEMIIGIQELPYLLEYNQNIRQFIAQLIVE